MKYSNGNNPSTLFCEQVSTVTSLFEKWNDCERTVVMYALLKRLRYPSLKFLLYSIENNLTQNFGSSSNNLTTLDINANNPGYLQNLITAYKSTTIPTSNINDNDSSVLYGSDIILQQQNENDKKYMKKEEVLNDVLSMLPLLRPGNDDAKTIYLSLIPLAVEDTVRQIVSTELVQQVFSYLLIHPAISNEDRKSLSHWLRHLEDHIQSSFTSSGHQSFYVLSSPVDSGSKSTSVSSLNSAWQAIAPPSQSVHRQQQQQQQQQQQNNKLNNTITDTEWNVGLLKIPDPLSTGDFQQIQLNDTVSSQNSLGLMYDNTARVIGSNMLNRKNTSTGGSNEDHHISFSKNGTEIYDYSANICDKCHGHIGYSSVLLGNSCEHHLNISKWSLDNSKITSISSAAKQTTGLPSSPATLSVNVCGIKTRRSNSLTTAISSSSSSTSSVITVNENCSNSSENLAQYAQKPRSYSLSIDNPRLGLTSSGSDTHLDDLKQPNYLKFSTHNIGMSNIGQWLKSLRLHKYVGLFTNTTYEEMLEITEDYLQSLGVTKGASHKLALCIEKLKERYSYLSKIEKDLLTNQITLNAAIEELTNIVLTPMKPVDSTQNNVAGKFLQVLDLVSQTVAKKEILSNQDEDCVNALLWILERSIHNEAFFAHTNQLKEHKFKLSKLKVQFAPKGHHTKNGNSSNLNKPRWNGKNRKNDNSKCGSNDRINRKNSNDTITFNSLGGAIHHHQQQQQSQQQSTIVNNSQYPHSEIDKFQCTKMSSSQQQQSHQQKQQQMYNGNVSNGSGSSCSGDTHQNTASSCPQYKSSSYPNFSNSVKIANQPQIMQHQQLQQHQTTHLQYSQQQSQYRHHRHSLTNLIMIPTNQQQQQQQQHQTQQQIIFKIPKQPVNNGMNLNKNCIGSNQIATTPNSSMMTLDCKNRRSSLSSNKSTTMAVPSNSSTMTLIGGGVATVSSNTLPGLTVSGPSSTLIEQMTERINNGGDKCDMITTSASGKSVSSLVSNLINSNNNNNSCSNSNSKLSGIVSGGGDSISSLSSISLSSSSPSSLTLTSTTVVTPSSVSSSASANRDKVLKSSIGDINSSLEFLCLQMTEQAIN